MFCDRANTRTAFQNSLFLSQIDRNSDFLWGCVFREPRDTERVIRRQDWDSAEVLHHFCLENGVHFFVLRRYLFFFNVCLLLWGVEELRKYNRPVPGKKKKKRDELVDLIYDGPTSDLISLSLLRFRPTDPLPNSRTKRGSSRSHRWKCEKCVV